MTAVSTKVVTSTIDAVARTNFLLIACFLSFMTLVVIVMEDTLIASIIFNNIKNSNNNDNININNNHMNVDDNNNNNNILILTLELILISILILMLIIMA